MKKALGLFLFLGLVLSLAQASNEKPVSVSYQGLLQCFPEVKNDPWALKVDLNQLKDEIDRRYASSQTLLQFRQVLLKDPMGLQKRLTWAAKPSRKKGHDDYEFMIEKLDARGAGTPQSIPASQRINPKQRDLDIYFVNQEIVQDDRSYFDTKLKGMSVNYKEHQKLIYELEWNDPRQKRRVFCEDKQEAGVVCTCFRK